MVIDKLHDSDMNLKSRIQILLDAGHTKTELARAAGKTAAAVSQWLSGETKEIKSDSAAGLAQLTGFSAVWIATGQGERMQTDDTGPAISTGAIELASLYDLIPISDRVGRAQAYAAASTAILEVLRLRHSTEPSDQVNQTRSV